jgi:RNA polymerase primary sigma factor
LAENHRRPSTLLSQYLNNVGRYPLLTAAQEIELARQVQRGLADDATPREKRRGKRAEDKIIVCNLRLVVVAAKEHTRKCTSFDLEDLIQLGNMGLAHAVKKFDPERGYKFSTYSRQWIHSYIRRGIINQDPMIRLPDSTYWRFVRVKQLVSPTVGVAEACDEVGIRKQDRARVLCAGTSVMSLNTPTGDRSNSNCSELGELIAQDYDDDQCDRLSSIRDIIATLPYDQQQALTHVYGLNGKPPVNRDRLGLKFGLSIWYGRQLIKKAEKAIARNPDAQELCGRKLGVIKKCGDALEAG